MTTFEGCGVAGGNDDTRATISCASAHLPVSINVVLSVQLTGVAQRGGLYGGHGILAAGDAREGGEDSAVRQASDPRAHYEEIEGVWWLQGRVGERGERAEKEFNFEAGTLLAFQSVRGRLRESDTPRMV